MKPLRVRARNYGPYPDLSWEIPAGLTALCGVNGVGDGADSNGAGKTKLLELVPICLFGPSLPWAEYLTTGGEETTCMVELEFEQAGERYRVRRTYDAKGRGKTTLDFEQLVGTRLEYDNSAEYIPDWDPLTRGDQRETQALIEQTIGLSEQTFAHSVFASQGARHFADPSLPPRERKALLTDALGLDIWDRLKGLCDADVAEARRDLDALTLRVGTYEEDLATLPEEQAKREGLAAQAALAENDLAECETVERVARETFLKLEAAAGQWEVTHARAQTATLRLRELDQLRLAGIDAHEKVGSLSRKIAEVEPLTADVDTYRDRLNVLTVAEATREEASRRKAELLDQAEGAEMRVMTLKDEISQYVAKAKLLRESAADRMNGNPGVCDHCGQTLAGEALAKAVASLERDAQLLEERAEKDMAVAATMVADVAELRQRGEAIVVADLVDGAAARRELEEHLAAASTAVTELAMLRAELATAKQSADRVTSPEFIQALADAEQEANEAGLARDALTPVDAETIGTAKRAHERANTDLVAARATERQCATLVAASEERLRNLAALAEKAQEALAAKTQLQGRLDVLLALSRAYGRDGIPVLLLETLAIPQVETEARRVLEALGMPFRIELVTQREKKTGGLTDTLDVVVHAPEGARRYESYSGGERTRLELALRIALARLIAHRSSSHCDLLALDEPAFLDATGMAQLAEVLRGLTEFRSIVLISHDERLVDAFDQRVTVVRDDSGSRLEAA